MTNMVQLLAAVFFFFFNDPAPTEIYTLSLHDALPIYRPPGTAPARIARRPGAGPAALHGRRGGLSGLRPGAHGRAAAARSEEHTSELQSQSNLVCRLLLEKKKRQSPPEPSHVLFLRLP